MNSINLIFPEEKISITVIRNISNPKISSKDIAFMAVEYLFFDMDNKAIRDEKPNP
jgi:hypothetical protein